MQATFEFLFVKGVLLLALVMSNNHVVSGTLCEITECRLISKVEKFGYGIDKTSVNVDVGECEAVYASEENCTIAESMGRCRPSCQAASYDMVLQNNRGGPITVPVVRSCHIRHQCQNKSCQRIPKILHFFPNSKYEMSVDVGDCNGSCDDSDADNSCLVTKSVSKSIEGPNGAITVDVVKECKCSFEKCYRVDHWESYFNHSICGNSTIQEEKLINIGKCVGGCEGVRLPGRCYPSKSNCILYVPGRGDLKCVPMRSNEDSYFNSNGEKQIVPTVAECGCATA